MDLKTPFSITILAFRQFWVKGPCHSENIVVEMCYLYRRTRHGIPGIRHGSESAFNILHTFPLRVVGIGIVTHQALPEPIAY